MDDQGEFRANFAAARAGTWAARVRCAGGPRACHTNVGELEAWNLAEGFDE
jgi:hypothetical protein